MRKGNHGEHGGHGEERSSGGIGRVSPDVASRTGKEGAEGTDTVMRTHPIPSSHPCLPSLRVFRGCLFLVFPVVAWAQAPATRPEAALALFRGPAPLAKRLEYAIPASADPRMLLIRGQLGAGQATFEIDGEAWGTAGGFATGGGLFEASMPLASQAAGGAKPRVFSIRPVAPGLVLDEVSVVPAARVRFVIRDQGSKVAIPGFAGVETIGGRPPPAQGPAGGFPRERAGWISADGHGDLYVPPGANVGFAARSSPFRAVTRQTHVIEARDNMLVTFLLSSDQLPEGATILEGPPRPGIAPDVQKAVDRARGIGKRPAGFKAVPAAELLGQGPLAVEEALKHPDFKFLATNETGPLLFPPVSLVTVELPGGELMHSNGPVILLADRRREGSAVRAFVKVRLPEGVVADKLLVWAGNSRTEHRLVGPTTVPLDVIVPPGTPIALIATGPEKPDTALERVAAFRVIRAP
jgi:hypothetical protein